MSAQYGGKKVQTIASGGAPPYGDVVNSALQDNAYALPFDSVAVCDNGHFADGQRMPGNVEPEPPGRPENPDRSRNGKTLADGTPTWLS